MTMTFQLSRRSSDCHTFSVTLLGFVPALCSTALDFTSGAYGARTRNLRRDRAAL